MQADWGNNALLQAEGGEDRLSMPWTLKVCDLSHFACPVLQVRMAAKFYPGLGQLCRLSIVNLCLFELCALKLAICNTDS